MPIEFRCTHCDRLLRVPDGTSGKDAKCPQCGTILKIPAVEPPRSAPLPPPPFRETLPVSDSQNPYQSPRSMATEAPSVATGFQPTRIDFADTFGRTWQLYKRNLGLLMGGALLTTGCNFVANMLLGGAFAIIQSDMEGAPLAAIVVLQQVVQQAVGAYFWTGLIMFMLGVARTERADLGVLFSGGPYLIYATAIQILVTLATLMGFILLVVPGIIIALMYSQSLFMLVDQKADILGSLRLSAQATRGNKLTLLAIFLAGGLGSMLFTLFTCFVGALFAIPFMTLLTAMVYLGVTGQATALDALPQQPLSERPFGAPGAQPTM